MKLTEPEWQLMNALWKKYPATAREIIEHIPGNVKWAYTTVKTMLTRLATKEAVSEKKNGNTSIYEPLMHFLVEHKKISTKERQELIRLLKESEK